MDKVPLLLFSGGLDSTYMLQNLLQESDVETMYVKGSQDQNKVTQELKVRPDIIKILEEKTGHKVLQDHVIDIGIDLIQNLPDHSWQQPISWLIGALKVSDGNKHSSLNIGYVIGDDTSCIIQNIDSAWMQIQAFTKHTPIPIFFPIHLETKQNVLARIHYKLYEHIWTCELPFGVVNKEDDFLDFEPCGKCVACLDAASYLFVWKKRTGKTYNQYLNKLSKPIKSVTKLKSTRSLKRY